jgi:hypothetical protein
MSVEEQAQAANLPFWMQSQRVAEEKEIDVMDGDKGGDDQGGDEDYEGGNGDSEGGDRDSDDDDTTIGGKRTDGAEDDTTDAGECTDAGEQMDVGSASAAEKKKAIRKDRDPPTLGTKREDFTKGSKSGAPEEPKALATGYEIQIGCIVRETVTINTRYLRDPDNAHLVQLLLQKLHEQYQFPLEYDNQNLKDNVVNQLALTKMSTALASWRTWVKKQIDKKESSEEIKKHEPLLEHDDYVLFKEELETDTALGKKMYEQNIGHHCLGSGGYRRIQPVCDAEDASLFVLASDTSPTYL